MIELIYDRLRGKWGRSIDGKFIVDNNAMEYANLEDSVALEEVEHFIDSKGLSDEFFEWRKRKKIKEELKK